jgi:hypothetical protein
MTRFDIACLALAGAVGAVTVYYAAKIMIPAWIILWRCWC